MLPAGCDSMGSRAEGSEAGAAKSGLQTREIVQTDHLLACLEKNFRQYVDICGKPHYNQSIDNLMIKRMEGRFYHSGDNNRDLRRTPYYMFIFKRVEEIS